MTDPQHIKHGLEQSLVRQGLGRVAGAAWLCQQANQMAKGRFRAVTFRDGTLTVRVPDSLLAYELRGRRDEVIRELREILGERAPSLKRLRVVIRENETEIR